jgi:hypothetical protein
MKQTKLIEQGFDYICDVDGVKLFRKRKYRSISLSFFQLMVPRLRLNRLHLSFRQPTL